MAVKRLYRLFCIGLFNQTFFYLMYKKKSQVCAINLKIQEALDTE